ncbi:hypothetical protein AB0K00_20690 [Dactylosporangium sp. NPDC049525]|uniref:hypothetical protein n=1 Tax=Dactylosporangium sp. NPDC049525 TaxID=3154730 RepID=UPI0034225312
MTTATGTRWALKQVPPPPTPEEAAEALASAEAALDRWIADSDERNRAAEAAAAELAEAEAVAGDAAYETPDDLDQLGEDLIRRRAQVEISHRAVTAARARVDAARREVLTARAVDVRTRANRLRAVAAARQARTDQLIAEVDAFEQTRFTVASYGLLVGSPPPPPMPLTSRMLRRAEWLDGQADELVRSAEAADPERLAAAVARPPLQADSLEDQAFGFDFDAARPVEPAASVA